MAKPCRKLLAATICLVLAGGVVFLLLPQKSAKAMPRLVIVKTALEQGKPVVFFRLDGDAKLRVLIHAVEKVTVTGLDGRYDSPVISKDVWAPGQLQEFAESAGQDSFWAPSQLPHWAFVGKSFGVLAPTNVPTWKLRVTATMSVPSSSGALKALPRMWTFCRSNGRTLSEIARIGWRMSVSGYTGVFETNVIESDTITNSAPSAVVRWSYFFGHPFWRIQTQVTGLVAEAAAENWLEHDQEKPESADFQFDGDLSGL